MSKLIEQPCEACRADASLATEEEIQSWLKQIPDWSVIEKDGVKQLEREFSFADFAAALAFVNRVGALAESENHHPVMELTWGQAWVRWWTHKIGGLHRNDFIMAARTDASFNES